MPFFPCAHAGHSQWQPAVKQVIVQLRAQISMQQLHQRTGLGVVYVSAPYAEHAHAIMVMLARALPDVQHWVGSAVHTVLAGDMDYGESGALAVMLPCISAQDYEVFSGMAPVPSARWTPHLALVHGDASAPQRVQHMQALRKQMHRAALVGGLCDLQHQHVQWAWGGQAASGMPRSIGGSGVQMGGFSGVAFGANVESMAVGMQGCQLAGDAYTITHAEGDVLLALDGKPALEAMFDDVDWARLLAQSEMDAQALGPQLPHSLMAMLPSGSHRSGTALSRDARVMRVVGIDPLRQGVVLDGWPEVGWSLARCQPDEAALRADMRRACAELWESLTHTAVAHAVPGVPDADSSAPHGRSICGAIYIRNRQRSRAQQAPQVDAELQLIRHALGPIPLLGFSSTCEIDAGQLQHLSAQLLVFTQPLQALT